MFKIALIGCGRIGWLLERDTLRYKPCTHLGAIRYWRERDRQLYISALCDSDLPRAEAAADFAGVTDTLITEYPSEALRTQPDLLVIAATTAAHFSLVEVALRARIPRIVLDKPVVFSAEEARALRKMLSRSRSVILPNYERRYHPKYIRLKALLEKEKRPGSYRAFFAAGGASLYANKKRGDEGVLLHDSTHLFDLAQFFYGPVKSHSVTANKRSHILQLVHENGSVGTLETALGIGVFHLELEMHLARERIIVGNGFLSRERIAASKHYKALRSYSAPVRKADTPFPAAQNPFVALYREAIYGEPTNAHFRDALANVEILSHPS